LTQKDPKVLHEIKNNLGFGTVKNFETFSRYIVTNNYHCFLLYLIFNNNLVIKSKINQLFNWYIVLLLLKKINWEKDFNINTIPDIYRKAKKPSLLTSWISGFTDAEGCFSAYIYPSKNKLQYCRCRFLLDQKNEQELLLKIRDLFCETLWVSRFKK